MKENRKDCYSVLDVVFPLGEDELRTVGPDCLACPDHTDCLKAALATADGRRLRSERLEEADRAGLRSRGGLAGFLTRWSELKTINKPPGGKRRGRKS